MKSAELADLARRMAAHLDCIQDVACRQILQAMVETGRPLAPVQLARSVHMSQESLAKHLTRLPDTEFDAQGNIVGWGMTLVPTRHQFLLAEHAMFTWCAFDTVLFPPLLQVAAHVQSVCATSGQPVTFVSTPERIGDLFPLTSVLSLILPDAHGVCVRSTFCEQSLFFQSKEAALPWMVQHPDAVLLSIEEAAALGRLTALMWSDKLRT